MKGVSRILVPIDFSENAANAFHFALQLARDQQIDLEVAHVVYPDYDVGMDVPVVAAQVAEEQIEAARELTDSFVRRGMEAVYGRHADKPNICGTVLTGTPVETISRLVKEKEVDLIVMGTRAKHHLWEEWMGTVAAGLVSEAPCHVWVVPEDAACGPIRRVACATELTAADPWHIWKAAQLLQPYRPVLFCVHVQTAQNGAPLVDTEELQSFYQNHLPSLDIRLFNIQGAALADSLNEFAKAHEIDLLVAFQPHRKFIERLFHRSATRRLTIHCRPPLLVIKEDC